MQTCSSCKDPKENDEFGRSNKLGLLKKICLECECRRKNENHKRWRDKNADKKGKWSKAWIKANHDKYIEYSRAANKRSRDKKRRAVYEYLTSHPCVDCGNSDPRVLEFDHVRGKKIAAISKLLSRSKHLSLIFEEIKKCDVRCANCHRIATITRGGLCAWMSPAELGL